MSLPRYPEYKDSGVPWVPDVPSHWVISPLKRIAELKSGNGITSEEIEEEGDFPVYGGNGVRGYTDRFTHDGEFALIGRQGALCGNINYAKGRFWASEHAVVVAPVDRIETRWLGELLRSMNLNQYSVSAAQPGLSVETISNHRIPVPPPDEQRAIATFLGRETAKIDALIAEQEKLLALLAEKRQATISHAVTRGLNPNAPMKDSGIPWLGEVPAHWDVMALGRVTVSKCDGPFGSGLKSDHYVEEGARVIRLQNIRGGRFDGRDAAFIELGYFESEMARHEVREGDLLIAGLGDDNNVVGRACVAPVDIYPALVKADCFRFRLDDEHALPEFAAWALTVGAAYDAGVLSSGSTRSRIPLSVMASRKIPVPPVSEQVEIARHIESVQSKFEEMAITAERAIELLRERRSALISAAVTGKIDVRQK